MDKRMQGFRDVLTALPLPSELPAELLVMSCGQQKGVWSYHHVFTAGETLYFIFRKSGWSNGTQCYWECVDRELNALMEAEQVAHS